MYKTNYVSIFSLSSAIIMAVILRDAAALDTANTSPMPIPNSRGGIGCGTSGCADSLEAVSNSSLVCFTYSDDIFTTVVASYCCISGQAGLGWSIELSKVLGILVKTTQNIYFLNAAGCPYIVRVQNNNNLVFGYRFFYGYLAFEVFASQTANCPYNCNTCRTSALDKSPNQIDAFQGKVEILFRNIRSYAMIPFGSYSFAASLNQAVRQYFFNAGYNNVNVQNAGDCILVNDAYVYQECCPVPKSLNDPNAYVLDSGDVAGNNNFGGHPGSNALCGQTIAVGYNRASRSYADLYRLYCDYVLKTAATANGYYQIGLNLRYRIAFASIFSKSLIVVSCYSSYTLYNVHSEAVSGFC